MNRQSSSKDKYYNGTCAKCDEKTDENNTYVCEDCERTFHPKCVAYDYAGSGEYPDEDAYCLCEECVPK